MVQKQAQIIDEVQIILSCEKEHKIYKPHNIKGDAFFFNLFSVTAMLYFQHFLINLNRFLAGHLSDFDCEFNLRTNEIHFEFI